jgi:filamentous hemagglutinin family protein
MLAYAAHAYALPTGGAVAAGSASIAGSTGKMTINQSSQNAVINWQSFNIGATEAVQFVQPNSSSVALNRVLGSDPSSILGSLSANGKVFLVNPNGILFGQGAQVNVGGLVASTRSISDADFMAGNYAFSGSGGGTVANLGSINADGGYVALLGASVSNQGVISARLGTVALASGNALTLDVAGDGLLNVVVNQGRVGALVSNGGLIVADGGQVLLTTQAAGNLLQTVVNNTGVIQAQTVQNHNGTISLMGDMQSGTVNVAGTLDASAPNGGNGGTIETSAASVNIANNATITSSAPTGQTGTWLIDPQDFTVAVAGGNITGAALSAELVMNNVTITTNNSPDTFVAGPPATPGTQTYNTTTSGNGDIFINDVIAWNGGAAPTATTLTFNAARDLTQKLGADITATTGNVAICCGRDVTLNGAVTTTNGSLLVSGGGNVALNGAISTTNGNIEVCAGDDINVNAKITLVNSGSIAAQSLGLPLGLTLSAGTSGTGPGVAGGTVIFGALTPPASVTRSAAPVLDITINYNPISYATPTNFSGDFILVGAINLNQRMLVFPGGADKAFDGTTTASLSSLQGLPAGVTLVAGPGSTAAFTDPNPGTGKTVDFTGYTLAGPNAANFALPVTCCGIIVGQTTATIVAAAPLPAAGSTGSGPGASGLPFAVVPPLLATAPQLGGLPINVLGRGITMPPVLVAEAPPVEVAPVESVSGPIGIVPPPYVPRRRVPIPYRN